MSWKDDKKWSDRFLPEIKRALGEHLISEPPIEEDAERNTDLMVLRLDAIRIGCRIRKFSYYANYHNEFTIRVGRPSGNKTELTKIIEGWGDYFFYGFSNKEETALHDWILGDLKEFRIWHSRNLAKQDGTIPGAGKSKHDNSSTFRAYKWADIPNFIVAKRGELI